MSPEVVCLEIIEFESFASVLCYRFQSPYMTRIESKAFSLFSMQYVNEMPFQSCDVLSLFGGKFQNKANWNIVSLFW